MIALLRSETQTEAAIPSPARGRRRCGIRSGPGETQGAGAKLLALTGAAAAAEMNIRSVAESRPWPDVSDRLVPARKAVHRNDRLAVGSHPTAQFALRRGGRRTVHARKGSRRDTDGSRHVYISPFGDIGQTISAFQLPSKGVASWATDGFENVIDTPSAAPPMTSTNPLAFIRLLLCLRELMRTGKTWNCGGLKRKGRGAVVHEKCDLGDASPQTTATTSATHDERAQGFGFIREVWPFHSLCGFADLELDRVVLEKVRHHGRLDREIDVLRDIAL